MLSLCFSLWYTFLRKLHQVIVIVNNEMWFVLDNSGNVGTDRYGRILNASKFHTTYIGELHCEPFSFNR